MSAYKQFNSSDIIISPLEVNKGYKFNIIPIFSSSGGYSFISFGTGSYSESLERIDAYGFGGQIERYVGKNIDYNSEYNYSSGLYSSFKESSIYHSVKHLYYTNYISGSVDSNGDFIMSDASLPYLQSDGVVTGSKYNTIYDNYKQTDLLEQKSIPTQKTKPGVSDIAVLSIPSNIFGDKIQPGSFKFDFGSYEESSGGTFTDDGEGRLISLFGDVVGNIVYTHGVATITNPFSTEFGYGKNPYKYSNYGDGGQVSRDFFKGFISGSDLEVSLSSSYTLYETQYKITIGESEFNYSQNPTTTSGNDGIPFNYITGSYFTPYISTVGLYNDAHELLAVGKLAKPLPTSKTTDTTILINIDRH